MEGTPAGVKSKPMSDRYYEYYGKESLNRPGGAYPEEDFNIRWLRKCHERLVRLANCCHDNRQVENAFSYTPFLCNKTGTTENLVKTATDFSYRKSAQDCGPEEFNLQRY
jgi:hypothetical protein